MTASGWSSVARTEPSLRYDLTAANLAASRGLFQTGDNQGPVEGLAISLDGRIATSIVSRRLDQPG